MPVSSVRCPFLSLPSFGFHPIASVTPVRDPSATRTSLIRSLYAVCRVSCVRPRVVISLSLSLRSRPVGANGLCIEKDSPRWIRAARPRDSCT